MVLVVEQCCGYWGTVDDDDIVIVVGSFWFTNLKLTGFKMWE